MPGSFGRQGDFQLHGAPFPNPVGKGPGVCHPKIHRSGMCKNVSLRNELTYFTYYATIRGIMLSICSQSVSVNIDPSALCSSSCRPSMGSLPPLMMVPSHPVLLIIGHRCCCLET